MSNNKKKKKIQISTKFKVSGPNGAPIVIP